MKGLSYWSRNLKKESWGGVCVLAMIVVEQKEPKVFRLTILELSSYIFWTTGDNGCP